MNPFLMSSKQLLAEWKTLRTGLQGKDERQQLQEVVDFWAQAPLATMAYDPEALDTYDTPWEMRNANDWCQNSVAVGMEFTLRLAGWAADRMNIRMMRDYDISEQRLILEVDGKYWLNYEYRQVSPVPSTNHDILETWKFTGKHYARV